MKNTFFQRVDEFLTRLVDWPGWREFFNVSKGIIVSIAILFAIIALPILLRGLWKEHKKKMEKKPPEKKEP